MSCKPGGVNPATACLSKQRLQRSGSAFSHGADISHTDCDGLNSLHWAAHSTNVDTMSRILKAVDKSCSDVASSVDSNGKNALNHLLNSLPNIEKSCCSSANGVDVKGRDSEGNSPPAAFLSNAWTIDDQRCQLLLSSVLDILTINHEELGLPHLFSMLQRSGSNI